MAGHGQGGNDLGARRDRSTRRARGRVDRRAAVARAHRVEHRADPVARAVRARARRGRSVSALRPAPERRGDPRITPKGAVIVGVDTYVIRGRVANLSRHGLLARTWITAPERLLGARANLGLRLDGGDADWIQLTGRILRIGSRTIAIALDGAPPGFTRTLDQAVSRSHRNDRAVTVVLVDGDVERRHAIADGFRAAGCEVVNAS